MLRAQSFPLTAEVPKPVEIVVNRRYTYLAGKFKVKIGDRVTAPVAPGYVGEWAGTVTSVEQ